MVNLALVGPPADVTVESIGFLTEPGQQAVASATNVTAGNPLSASRDLRD